MYDNHESWLGSVLLDIDPAGSGKKIRLSGRRRGVYRFIDGGRISAWEATALW